MIMTIASTQRLSADCCELGEGAHYDAKTDTAWWLDIVGQSLVEHRLASGETILHALPRMASVVARIDDDRQLLVMEDGIHVRAMADGALSLLAPLEADNARTRSNDGRVHPSGALWVGTMGKKAEPQAGAIYWFDGTTPRTIFSGVSIPNSICFSPDGRTAYFADTAINKIWRVGVDAATGLPSGEPEVFLSEDDLPLGGSFDGSVTDVEGNIWNAAWGAGSVSGFTPEGKLIRTFEIPAARTTCPAFVGSGLDRLLVTTAWEGYDPAQRASDPGAGYTYVIEGGFSGRSDPDFSLPHTN